MSLERHARRMQFQLSTSSHDCINTDFLGLVELSISHSTTALTFAYFNHQASTWTGASHWGFTSRAPQNLSSSRAFAFRDLQSSLRIVHIINCHGFVRVFAQAEVHRRRGGTEAVGWPSNHWSRSGSITAIANRQTHWHSSIWSTQQLEAPRQ